VTLGDISKELREATYNVRPMKAGWYEIAKFLGTKAPVQIYDVLGESCTCPMGGSCKHSSLARIHAGLRPDALRTYWQDKYSKWQWYEIILEHIPPPPRGKARKMRNGRR
jgi:hypothetical protein